MNRIGPLNFARMVALARGELAPERVPQSNRPGSRRRSAIACWKCPECLDTHDDEDEAEECCQGPEGGSASPLETDEVAHCPVCARGTGIDFHEAVTCCLWKDIGPVERYAIATRMERGDVTWAEALEPYLPGRIVA